MVHRFTLHARFMMPFPGTSLQYCFASSRLFTVLQITAIPLILGVLLLITPIDLSADNHELTAFSVEEKIRIDGFLNESAWQGADVATDFVQLQPLEGEPASERSRVRILYGKDALYVDFTRWILILPQSRHS